MSTSKRFSLSERRVEGQPGSTALERETIERAPIFDPETLVEIDRLIAERIDRLVGPRVERAVGEQLARAERAIEVAVDRIGADLQAGLRQESARLVSERLGSAARNHVYEAEKRIRQLSDEQVSAITAQIKQAVAQQLPEANASITAIRDRRIDEIDEHIATLATRVVADVERRIEQRGSAQIAALEQTVGEVRRVLGEEASGVESELVGRLHAESVRLEDELRKELSEHTRVEAQNLEASTVQTVAARLADVASEALAETESRLRERYEQAVSGAQEAIGKRVEETLAAARGELDSAVEQRGAGAEAEAERIEAARAKLQAAVNQAAERLREASKQARARIQADLDRALTERAETVAKQFEKTIETRLREVGSGAPKQARSAARSKADAVAGGEGLSRTAEDRLARSEERLREDALERLAEAEERIGRRCESQLTDLARDLRADIEDQLERELRRLAEESERLRSEAEAL